MTVALVVLPEELISDVCVLSLHIVLHMAPPETLSAEGVPCCVILNYRHLLHSTASRDTTTAVSHTHQGCHYSSVTHTPGTPHTQSLSDCLDNH